MLSEVSHIRTIHAAPGVDLMRAYFRGTAFAPHRHDTYAVGVTRVGVQSFSYRGASHDSIASETFILHPDELHDGRAGDDRGFGYAIAYVDPAVIREILDGEPAPFVRDPICTAPAVQAAVHDLVSDWSALREPLALDAALTRLAEALRQASGGGGPATRSRAPDLRSAFRMRERLLDAGPQALTVEDLAAACGLSRWQLTRRFREAFGVSPYRYLQMRRLERARDLLTGGADPAQAALEAGFADQAHLTRQFGRAFGIPPGAWRRLAVEPGDRGKATISMTGGQPR